MIFHSSIFTFHLYLHLQNNTTLHLPLPIMNHSKKTAIGKYLTQKADTKGYNQIIIKAPRLPLFRLNEVKGGSFIIEEEKVKQTVMLNPFYMAEYPVTQELYEAVRAAIPLILKE